MWSTSRWKRGDISDADEINYETTMNPEFATDTLKSMIFLAITVAAPFLLAAMLIGLGVGLFQAVTSIHEQTLTFVPKALGVSGLIVLLLPWIMRKLIEFTTALIERMPQMVGG